MRAVTAGRGERFLACATLGIGVLVATCAFTAVNGVLLRPLPYDQPDRIIRLWESHPATGRLREGVSPLDHRDWAEASRAFDAIALWEAGSMALRGAGEPEYVRVVRTTPNLFRVLRTPPRLGRTLESPRDDDSTEPGVVISEALWVRLFGQENAVLSRAVFLNDAPYRIVGVMPQSFQFPMGVATDAWVPLSVPAGEQRVRAARRYQAVGVLAGSASLELAANELTGIAAALADAHPGSNDGWTVSLARVSDERRDRASSLLILLGCAGAILVLALVTATGLFLVVAVSRQADAAVRAALGASALRLVADSLRADALPAAVTGLTAAWAGQALTPRIFSLDGGALAGAYRLDLDARVVAFGILVSAGPALLACVGPAIVGVWARPGALLRARTDTASAPRLMLLVRRGLTAIQVAVAIALLSAAALLGRSFTRLIEENPGFRAEGVLVATVSLPSRQLNAATARFFRDLIEQIRVLPAVRSVAVATALPMSPTEMDAFPLPYQIEGEPELPVEASPRIQFRAVTPGYFRTIGRPLLTGRDFDDADSEPSAPLRAIISQAVARRHFAGRSAIGGRLRLPFGGWHEIIGVCGDVRFRGLDDTPSAEVYLPYGRRPFPTVNLVARVDADPALVARDVRAVIRTADPNLPVIRLTALADLVSDTTALRRFAFAAVGALAAVAWLVSLAGTYGLVRHVSLARRGELGIRAALGATPRQLIRPLVFEGFAAAAAGAAIGLATAASTTQLLASVLYRTSATEWPMLALAAGIQIVTAGVATWLPAAAAIRSDPAVAIRLTGA